MGLKPTYCWGRHHLVLNMIETRFFAASVSDVQMKMRCLCPKKQTLAVSCQDMQVSYIISRSQKRLKQKIQDIKRYQRS